jgi:hypothetical protein
MRYFLFALLLIAIPAFADQQPLVQPIAPSAAVQKDSIISVLAQQLAQAEARIQELEDKLGLVPGATPLGK